MQQCLEPQSRFVSYRRDLRSKISGPEINDTFGINCLEKKYKVWLQLHRIFPYEIITVFFRSEGLDALENSITKSRDRVFQ